MDAALKLNFNIRKTSTLDFSNNKWVQEQKVKGAFMDIAAQKSMIGYMQAQIDSIVSGAKGNGQKSLKKYSFADICFPSIAQIFT